MKKFKTTFGLLAACLLTLGAISCQKTEEKTLRIMSYNIRNGISMSGTANLDSTAAVILRANPDILAVQEIDSVTKRSKQTDILQTLAKKVSMHYVFAPAIDFSGGRYGIGMLSKEQPVSFRTFPLPGREEKRTFLLVEFKDFVYCCTHLSLTPEDQLLSLPIIYKAISNVTKPLFIAGDLNAHPDSELITSFQKDFRIISPTHTATYPADQPNETLDYIGVLNKDTAVVTPVSRTVLNEPQASDHRPILSVVKLTVKK